MIFQLVPEFESEFKRLKKKYRTLDDDLDVLKEVLTKYPEGYSPHTIRVPTTGVETPIFKVKHFRCRAIKGKGSRSGIRIIYAFLPEEQKIIFCEIYSHSESRKDYDRKRIQKYFR